jgi:tryptophan 2,3-dioxygenase
MLFDQKKWMKLQKEGKKKLGQKATLNALFIMLYREAPILNMPFRLLTSLMNIDENFTTWRYRHALLAKRMLGSKVGTGGSSGHQYLKNAADHNRVFEDFFNLSTFIIPRQMLPKLPKALQKSMDFHFTR